MQVQQARPPTLGAATGTQYQPPSRRKRATFKTHLARGRAGGPVWRSPRAGFFSSAWLGLLRLRRSVSLLAAVGLGIVVAVVLICTVPLYDSLVTGVQLQRELAAAGPLARNVEVQVDTDSVSAQTYTSLDQQVRSIAQQYLSSFVQGTTTSYVQIGETLLAVAGTHTLNVSSSNAPEVRFQAFDYAAAASHMRLISGSPPSASSGAATSTPRALITQEMAQAYGLTVGTTLTVVEFGSHNVQQSVTISGIWTPIDPNDAYWNGLSFAAGGTGTTPQIFPVQLASGDLLSDFSSWSLTLSSHWIYYTQPDQLTIATVDSIRASLADFQARLGSAVGGAQHVSAVNVLTQLDELLGGIAQQQALLSLPLYMIVAQIVALALLFVATMAGLLVEGQSWDIATLKSRGASGLQILSVFVTQGGVLALVALALGPFLAGELALALLRQFLPASSLSGTSGAYLSALVAPQAAVVPALAGALLGVATVASAALQSARLEVLAFRREQARPMRVPFWQRYYLDLAVAALCLVAYLDLSQFGSASVRTQLGGASSPLLLLAPALLLLAGALLVLRAIPLGASLGARFAARGRGFIAMLALSQVERTPNRYTRITLLLVLAVGLGLFAVTFDASLTRNASDRAAYDTGADVRLQMRGAESGAQGTKLAQQFATLPGVQTVMPAYRSTARTSPDQGDQPVDMLGIDPGAFAQVAGGTSWRPDYASAPLATLLADMVKNHRNGGSGEAAGTVAAPVYALVSETFADQNALRVGDQFGLQLSETSFGQTYFVVGHIIQDFPTLYPTHSAGGFLVADIDDYNNAIGASSLASGIPAGSVQNGPNEYWLKTSSGAGQHAALVKALQNATLDVKTALFLSDAQAANAANPVGAGIRGLLVVGAITAALLAVLGSVIQSLLATRQRATQLAILRTLGTARSQLTGLLLCEQVVVYLFGLIGGTLLGLLLTTATLPFLQFSDTLGDASRLGVPPYVLVYSPQGMLTFYGALLVAFAVALLVAAQYAARIGLGQALRLGED